MGISWRAMPSAQRCRGRAVRAGRGPGSRCEHHRERRANLVLLLEIVDRGGTVLLDPRRECAGDERGRARRLRLRVLHLMVVGHRVDGQKAGRNEEEERKEREKPRNQIAPNSVILRPVAAYGEMQSVRDEVWGPVRQRGEQHACVRLITNLQVPVPPVHALPLRSRRPAPRGLALTNLRLLAGPAGACASQPRAHAAAPSPHALRARQRRVDCAR